MIVVGVDVHKQSLSAVAVDEVGRQLDCLETSDGGELIAWSKRVGRRRLWALEDCRHVTRGLERLLQEQRQRLVRVPPRLTGPERRRGRMRGKSDLIDALAIARAALREPVLDSPRPEEARLRELKLLVDHRDDLVDERRRAQQRLRWHLHELDPTLQVPLGALDRSVWLERLSRQLARRQQTVQVRIARELLSRCRSLTRAILELDRELRLQAAALAPGLLELPGCGGLTAAKLLCEIGPVDQKPRPHDGLAVHANRGVVVPCGQCPRPLRNVGRDIRLEPPEPNLVAVEEPPQLCAQRFATITQHDRPVLGRRRRTGLQTFRPPQPVVRERAHPLPNLRHGGGELRVVVKVDPENPRRLNRAEPGRVKHPERHRHLPDHLTRLPLTDHTLHPVEAPQHLDSSLENTEQRPFVALVHDELTRRKRDICDQPGKPVAFRALKVRKDRDPPDLLRRHHD
jgi:transposase